MVTRHRDRVGLARSSSSDTTMPVNILISLAVAPLITMTAWSSSDLRHRSASQLLM